jgi:hypothetical protein
MLPPPSFGEYVVDGEVTTVSLRELEALQVILNTEMAKRAYGELQRDDALLAYMALLESAFYSRGWASSMQSEAAEPAVDLIISRYPDDRPCSRASVRALARARRWWRPSSEYADLLNGFLNTRLGRMQAGRTNSGTLVFYPTMDAQTELRNRWFDVMHFRRRQVRGHELMRGIPNAARIAARIDRDVMKQRVHEGAEYAPPSAEQWYRDYCFTFADRALEAQFRHVDQNEHWGAMDRNQVIAALRPIFRRSCLRMMAHLRAFKILAEVHKRPQAILHSTIEIVDLNIVAREVQQMAKLTAAGARQFVESLVRRNTGEKYKVASYPLLPMHGDRALLAPSVVLFSNWPAAREQAIARDQGDAAALGDARNTRYTNRAATLLREVGFLVQTDILLSRPDGSALTDLDVVAMSPDQDEILVLQLKSFVTPSNLVDIRRADRHVAGAIEQCRRADANLPITRSAIERRFAITLPNAWVLKQAIVVESNAGGEATPPQYPVITLEWLEARVAAGMKPSPAALWMDACSLPDASRYFASCAPLFIFPLEELSLPHSVAVFEYKAEEYLV